MQQVLLFMLLLKFIGAEDDNLKNALNSIENRQRQLATTYYLAPSKDTDRGVQFDDDNLMYLDSGPSEYDVPHNRRFNYPSKSSKNYRVYEDERLQDAEAEEYRKALNERLVEQLMLDILKNDDEVNTRRPQKKSFFREREFSEVSDDLQNLNKNIETDKLYLPPSSFRERTKSKLHLPLRRISKPFETENEEEMEEEENYSNGINPLWKQYDGHSIQGSDPETLTDEEVEGFLKYIVSKDFPNNEDLDPEIYYGVEDGEKDRIKHYRSSDNQPPSTRYAIQKRSTKEEIIKSANKSEHLVAKTTKPNQTSFNKTSTMTKTHTKREKKGQKEIPLDMKSLKPLNIKKKSIDWSNYFGVNKRQSSNVPKEHTKNDVLLDQYIQSYILQSVRNSAFNNRGSDSRYFPKRNGYKESTDVDNVVRKKLETTEDLQAVQDIIIDHVLKYMGAHEGVTDSAELQRFKEKIINELSAAYNLEKLRHEIFENTKMYPVEKKSEPHQQHKANKRVAIKKDNANLNNFKLKQNVTTKYIHGVEKKNSIRSYLRPNYETNEILIKQCSDLNEIIGKCLEISSQVKDRDKAFTPFCTLHQICNICGLKRDSLSCDLSFYKDAITVCNDEPLCKYTAQKVLHILQSEKSRYLDSADICSPCITQIIQDYTF